ncbi:hypothetical protein [Haloechinothrix salitolerans]|uniref:hypothetical protein n=1 Tax=Haloechinothrix salitolerans TaxID=926830 RepID=UPI0031E93F3D
MKYMDLNYFRDRGIAIPTTGRAASAAGDPVSAEHPVTTDHSGNPNNDVGLR